MDTLSLLGFIVSTVALAMSVFAVVYARRQARAAELQVRLKLELMTRSRLIESLEISIAGPDPSQLNALVKSMFDRSINDLRITLLPAHMAFKPNHLWSFNGFGRFPGWSLGPRQLRL